MLFDPGCHAPNAGVPLSQLVSPNETARARALTRARRKAYGRLLPLLFVCYVIAYVDRTNVSIAKFTMMKSLPGFDEAVIGMAAGIFFLGYFLLEIPGSVLAERWSARKWIARIMITWGVIAALTAFVTSVPQFYLARFALGLAEAGFFPGVVVYLSHWFGPRDRARALTMFFLATPIAQIVSPKICYLLLRIGTEETAGGMTVYHERLLDLEGWQWIYIAWGAPAVLLAIAVLAFLPDRPAHAKWLSDDERLALEGELMRERSQIAGAHTGFWAGLKHPRVMLLCLAYFFAVTGSYGVEFFLPSILRAWHNLDMASVTTLLLLPPACSLIGQLTVAWNSDRTGERVAHAAVPLALAAAAIASAPLFQSSVVGTVACFAIALAGLKAFLPAFWSLPNLFLAELAAAGSIGLVNSIGNLGGFLGPATIGVVQRNTGSYTGGLIFVAGLTGLAAVVILVFARLSRR